MTAIKCSKCGVTANSKNPYCRNVFMDNQYEAVLSWIFKRRLETDSNGHKWLHLDISVTEGHWAPAEQPETKGWVEDELSETQAMERGFIWLHETLKRLVGNEYPDNWAESDRLTLDQWLCDHDWVKVNPDQPWEVEF